MIRGAATSQCAASVVVETGTGFWPEYGAVTGAGVGVTDGPGDDEADGEPEAGDGEAADGDAADGDAGI